MDALAILRDAASRPLDVARELRAHLTPELLNAHPGGHDNSIAWLLWHSAREIDVQLAHLTGSEEVWRGDGFRDRFVLGSAADSVGYGHSATEARSIVSDDPDLLIDYLGAATAALDGYLSQLSEADLDEVIDHHWTPPVTRGARLVSIIDDAAQHAGQASYVVGMRG